jgi:FKBP-type peptidyl-prolyl cis-trans isomerase FkpA
MSVTAVPLRPIKKGSVRRIWFGVAVVVAGSALLTWNGLRPFGRTASGIAYQILQPGKGENPARDDFALLAYKGQLPDGTVFDENAQAPMDLTGTVPGFSEAVTLLKKGGHIRVKIPASLAYGATPPQGSPIPADSPLIFDLKLTEFMTRAQMMELQQQRQMQQMLQQGMQPGGGAPGGPPGGVPGQPPMPQGAPVPVPGQP